MLKSLPALLSSAVKKNLRFSSRNMSSPEEIVKDNFLVISNEMNEIHTSSSRLDTCKLVAVSKTKPASLIEAIYNMGHRHFGENYVHELQEKSETLSKSCPEIRWHFIGQIQSNKIPKIAAVKNLYCVETLETEKHCSLFEKEMYKRENTLNVLIQVNTSDEDQKGGLGTENALKLADFVQKNCPHLRMSGFMTIGSVENSQKVPNPDFERLGEVRRKWAAISEQNEQELELSMGMSEDFATAIRQGSTSIRVGSKIFGPRLYKN